MRILLRAILALVLGLIGGWAVSLSACLRFWDLMGYVDHDGGGAMAAFFIIGPFFGLVTGIMAATTVLFRSLRTGQPVAGHTRVERVRSPVQFALLRVAVASATYLVVWCMIELSGPYGPRSAITFFIDEGVPLAAAIAAGVFGALRFRSRPPQPA